MSPDTLAVFAELLDQVQLPSTHPDLVNAARRISIARTELIEAINQSQMDSQLRSMTDETLTDSI